jgi:hypothetical protein
MSAAAPIPVLRQLVDQKLGQFCRAGKVAACDLEMSGLEPPVIVTGDRHELTEARA